jgi:hypothetical protein
MTTWGAGAAGQGQPGPAPGPETVTVRLAARRSFGSGAEITHHPPGAVITLSAALARSLIAAGLAARA